MNDQISRSWDANATAWSTAVRERQIESRRVATDEAIVAVVEAREVLHPERDDGLSLIFICALLPTAYCLPPTSLC